MTASQGKIYAKQFIKDEAKGNPILIALLPVLIPLFVKLIEGLINKNDIVPKSEEGES